MVCEYVRSLPVNGVHVCWSVAVSGMSGCMSSGMSDMSGMMSDMSGMVVCRTL